MTQTVTENGAGRPAAPARKVSWRFVVPVLIFVAIAGFLAVGLTKDPRLVPSPLIGKLLPQFDLPPVLGREKGLSTADFKGDVSLLNVFASWCVSCREEHPVFLEASRKGLVPIHGLDYKDKPKDAKAWLDELGDPYTRTGADIKGRVGIDLGVYGVPETFLIDRDGRIVYKHIGPVTRDALENKIMPMVERLRRGESIG